ncbi:MAG: amidohydrolase [Candidatus Aminicenantes bacterium]|jgi:predicted amidohydrolase YtcJ
MLRAKLIPILSCFLFVFSFGCRETSTSKPADTIYINGHVLTMDDENPEVGAFAISQGKILSIGTSEEIAGAYPEADVVDLERKTVMPGIIESHGHLLSLGQSFLELNVEGIETPDDVVLKVKERVKNVQTGEWITGWGWDEGAWAKSYPTNRELSEVSPENPVYLRGLHGFACWANAKALELAGIDKDTPNPENGEIIKDPQTGKPTGILTNEAQDLLTGHIPPMTVTQTEKALKLAIEECLKYGLTSIHEARTTTKMLEALNSLKNKKELKSRIYVMLDCTEQELIETYFESGPSVDPENFLTVRCIKIFVDGALGSRGAAMIEPYSDAPDEKGLVVTPEDEVYRLSKRALQCGLQVAIHAIGDRANRITLNAFQRALEENPDVKDHRFRLEHAQVVALEDIPKFAPLGVVLSMQPPHATSDMPWAETRVGPERIKGAYAWRSFWDSGVHMTLNSDFPGETLDPFVGMYTAMTRQTPENIPEGGWYPEQCLQRDEVLKAYTIEAAYSGFEEDIKGKIVPGMLADFIVLSGDILNIPVKEFLDIKVQQTYLGGRLVYERQ